MCLSDSDYQRACVTRPVRRSSSHLLTIFAQIPLVVGRGGCRCCKRPVRGLWLTRFWTGVLVEKVLSPGMRGAMFSVIDALRDGPAPADDVRRMESISIALHKLEWARQQRDDAGSVEAVDELRALAVGWLNARICGPLS